MKLDQNDVDPIESLLKPTLDDVPPVDEQRLREIALVGGQAFRRQIILRRIRRWGLSAAAAAIAILCMIPFITHSAPAYAFSDIARRVMDEPIQHWKTHTTYASGSESTIETWADFSQLRFQTATVFSRMVDGQRKVTHTEGINNGEKTLMLNHDEKWAMPGSRTILSQRIWMELQRQEMLVGALLGPGGIEAGFENKGIERIDGVECDLWQAAVPSISRFDPEGTVKAWVSRDKKEIVRVLVEIQQKEGVFRQMIEMLPAGKDQKFDIHVPADYSEKKTTESDPRVPHYLSDGRFQIMPVFLLPDGSLVVGWSLFHMDSEMEVFRSRKTGDAMPKIPGGLESASVIRSDGEKPLPLKLLAVTQSVDKDSKTTIVWTLCGAGEALKGKGAYRYEIKVGDQAVRPAVLFPIRDKKDFDELVIGTLTQWNDNIAPNLDYDQVMNLAKDDKAK